MTKPASRREFLKMAAALSATRFAPPLALNLAALGESAAATATDYKALVCVFMIGGNDNFNTLVPYDAANYAIYNQQRPAIATALSALTPTLLTPATRAPRRGAIRLGAGALPRCCRCSTADKWRSC